MDSRVLNMMANPKNMLKCDMLVMHLKGNMMLRGAGSLCSMQGGRQYKCGSPAKRGEAATETQRKASGTHLQVLGLMPTDRRLSCHA